MGLRHPLARGPRRDHPALPGHLAAPTTPLRVVRRHYLHPHVRAWGGAARPGLGVECDGRHRRRRRRDQLPACGGGRGGRPARRTGGAAAARRPGRGRPGILQPRARPAERGADRRDDRGGAPARGLRRAAARRRRGGAVLRSVARPAVRGQSRGLLPAAQPRVDAGARVRGSRAQGVAVPRLRAPRRPRRDHRGAGRTDHRPERGRLREPVSRPRRHLPLAAVDGDAVYRRAGHLRRRPRRHRAHPGHGAESGSGGAARPDRGRARDRPPPGRGGDARQGRVPRQHEPRDPHADERGDRHDRAGAADPADAAAARVHPDRPPVGRGAARHPQRHPRRVEGRGRTDGARVAALRSARRRRRCREADGAAGPREGPRAGLPHSRPTSRTRWSATPAGCGR